MVDQVLSTAYLENHLINRHQTEFSGWLGLVKDPYQYSVQRVMNFNLGEGACFTCFNSEWLQARDSDSKFDFYEIYQSIDLKIQKQYTNQIRMTEINVLPPTHTNFL